MVEEVSMQPAQMAGNLSPDVAERVRRQVADDRIVAAQPVGPRRVAAIRTAVARAVREEGLLLPAGDLASLVRQLTDNLAGLGPVEALLREPDVTDVMVNGPDEVWVERAGRLERTSVAFPDAETLRLAVVGVIGPLGLRWDRARPFVDARLADGSRLHGLLPPVAPAGPLVTIRTFAPVVHSWADLEASGAVPPDAAALLRQAVAERRAVITCGRTGTGKTTLLNLLLSEVGPAERVVVIEDAPELRLRCPHAVRLETRPANADGAGEVTLRDLVRQALRMRPDRIVVGEVRGVEIVDVLQALATGHEGCMTTVHARAADEALVRLEGMALLAGLPLAAARAQLRVGLDVVAVLGRGPDGRRGLVQVAEVVASGGDGPLATAELWRRERWA
jgi:pilus assembly protein CpaF